uniref:ABC transporter domain-containing protein n=1 Tax=Rhabditophanes sp. KR3021 TaxID=114890 RepID=A0AC35TRD7_9BILA
MSQSLNTSSQKSNITSVEPTNRPSQSEHSVSLTWSGITVSVPYGKGRKTVLTDICGVAEPYEMLAIMGGSGAGKSTLLNVMTNIDQHNIKKTGVVRAGGKIVTPSQMRTISAYVQQVDIFAMRLTVMEQLQISAELRIGNKYSERDRNIMIETLISQMSLGSCKDTMIGGNGEMKGISVGEKKRLAIACELMDNPSILYCDEPTSGLDSYIALQVVNAMKAQAALGKTVISTIHQPSSEVFYKFDKVCLMAKGKVAYFGPVKVLTKFWESISPTLACPFSYNPADYVIRMLSITEEDGKNDVGENRIRLLIDSYEQSPYCAEIIEKAKTKFAGQNAEDSRDSDIVSQCNASWTVQFYILTIRSFKTLSREPFLFRARLVQVGILGSIVMTMFWNQQLNSTTIQNFEGLIYIHMLHLGMFMMSTTQTITSDLPLAFREHKAGVYDLTSYYSAKSVAEIPQMSLFVLMYSVMVYWSTGLYRDIYSFIRYFISNWFSMNISISLAYTAACIFVHEHESLLCLTIVGYPMVLFAGFYIRIEAIPLYYQWLSKLSWYQYSFGALYSNQFINVGDIKGCVKKVVDSGGAFLKEITTTTDNSRDHNHAEVHGFCPASTGIGLMQKRSLNEDSYYTNLGCLILFFVIVKVIGGVSIYLRGRYSK